MLEEAADTRRCAALRAARLRLYGRLSPEQFLTFLTLTSATLKPAGRPRGLPSRSGTYRL